MRTITSETIVRTVKNLCLRANKFLPSDIKLTLDTAYDYEISPNGKRAIGNIIDNYKVSQQTSLPICQDTGMVVVFAEIGQDVHIVGELFEDGWTTGELDAMTQDEGVKREIASGHGIVRAACGYLKRMLETAAARKGNVPIARTTAAGAVRPGSAIEQMSDREFAAFSKRAQEAMMAGKKVRME